MPYDPRDPDYFDPKAAEKEMARVTELCNGCRRCYRLCPSFDYMLDEAVDGNDGDVDKITSADYRKIVDLCWQCKLCYNHCPYTPPHKWDIDFPRLMLRAKAARARAEGVSRGDAWLGNVDAVGTLGCASAPLSNWANSFAPHRALLEAVVGIDRKRNLPRFHHKTFARWFRERGGARVRDGHAVALFYSCSVNYNEPQVGRDAVSVLEKNGCTLTCPEQSCCGMPYLDGGDLGSAAENARKNLARLGPLVKQGAKVLWWNVGRLRVRSIPATASRSARWGAKELAQLLRGAVAQPRVPTASTSPSQASCRLTPSARARAALARSMSRGKSMSHLWGGV
ncbi:MAG TPA: heterodisulfide reductase-related iron-sulfur binding cluster [Vicinamibacteria bacterium]